MTFSAFANAAVEEDLGGGFALMRRADRERCIVATSLSGSGAIAAMMPAPASGRRNEDVVAWLHTWNLSGHVALRAVNQVHRSTVVAASEIAGSHDPPDADGLWSDSSGDVLLIRSADCPVVWIVDPAKRLMAMLHAGWRGLAGGIVGAGVKALCEVSGMPARMLAAVGPHIRPCCFEVGPEVAGRFEHIDRAARSAQDLVVERKRQDSVSLDLAAAIVSALQAAGIPAEAISVSMACTRCRADVFHSYRRNGPGGPLMAAIGKLL